MNRIVKNTYIEKQNSIMEYKTNCFEDNSTNNLEFILINVINNSNEAIMVLDNKNRVKCYNNKISKLFKNPKVGFMGGNITDVVKPALGNIIVNKIKGNSTKALRFYYPYKKNKNKTVNLQVTIKSIKSKSGSKLNILYFLDKTKDVEIKNKLIKMKVMAENTNKLKSMFLAQMSHEIRTPINAIVGFSSLIKEDVKNLVNDELITAFDAIEHASKRIIRTIDLLLNFSEIQTHSYECIFREIDPENNILLPIIEEYKKIASKKGIEIKFYSNVPRCKVKIDEYSTNKIFVHLIENAIKYTSNGYISISLNNTDEGKIVVKIADTGIGISKTYLPKIFNPFSQEEQGYTRKYDGNGIGLALVKEYCKLNKIKIMVNSTKNVGTVFTLVFFNSLG